jgi:hypothetical protein
VAAAKAFYFPVVFEESFDLVVIQDAEAVYYGGFIAGHFYYFFGG